MKNILLTCGIVFAMLNAVSVQADRDKPSHGKPSHSKPSHGKPGHGKPDRHPLAGAVYTMDNSAGGNQVWVLGRRADGSLADPVAHPTGGTGTGGGLGNQGGLLLSSDGHWLFACNAGSDEISVFSVAREGLMLSHTANSGGHRPISLTLHRNLLYVLNAGGAMPGGSDNIAGFLFVCGQLIPLPGSAQALSAASTDPAQVAFTRDGNHLVVTEKATGLLDIFSLDDCGFVSGVQMFVSPAPPPFGFAVGRHNRIYVTQANGGAANPGGSSVSSYEVTDDGALMTLSDSVATEQTAACWLVLSPDEHFAYTANTPNDSISSLIVQRDGELELQEAQAALTGPGSGPVDMALSRDGRFLYSLNAGNGTIGAFWRHPRTGTLHPLAGASGLPAGANGLAAK